MATQMVRLSVASHALLAEMARETGLSRQAILERALDQYRRARFFAALDGSYGRLHADPEARAGLDVEMRAWDGALEDGLADAPYEA
jgi:hypothetical protein